MLTSYEIKEFQNLALIVLGLHLTDKEAQDQAERLIKLFELMLRQRRKLVNQLANSQERG